ncbi:MAG: hypothetical protein ACJ8AS_11715 [Hyphomicrobiales bacterium]
MIYTFGLKKKYDAILAADPHSFYKRGKSNPLGKPDRGGGVWKTPEDVRAYLRSKGWEDIRDVYGVDADWDRDTYQDPETPFRRLLRSARVVKLEP